MFDLNSENIHSFSENSYRNPQCICAEDFHEDMNRVKYVKRLLNKYKKGEELKTRLILNHIICFYNVFDKYSATRIWFFKIDRDYWPVLKTFLEYLSLMEEITCYFFTFFSFITTSKRIYFIIVRSHILILDW